MPDNEDQDQIQSPRLEAFAQPLMRLSEFMQSGREDAQSPITKLGHAAYDMSGLGALGNTLHRFAMGDSHKYTPEERTQANLDLLGAMPAGTEGLNLARGGMRRALAAAEHMPAGQLNMFAGVDAMGSDLGALENAKIMSSSGKSPEEIHAATGWFKGKDGQWRYEIDDSTSAWKAADYLREKRAPQFNSRKLISQALDIRMQAEQMGQPVGKVIEAFERANGPLPDAVKGLAHSETPDRLEALAAQEQAKILAPLDARLGDVLQHQRLYEAYPDLKDAPVHFNDLGPYLQGSMQTGPYPKMKLNNRNSYGNEGHSTVLHEIQHQIQHEEGFDPGESEGSILERSNIKSVDHAMLEDTVQAAIDIRNGNSLFRHINPDAAELADDTSIKTSDLEDHLKTLQRNRPQRIAPAKAKEMYTASGGEVEARATEKRRKMSQEERKRSYPMKDYDVPPDQILLRNQR